MIDKLKSRTEWQAFLVLVVVLFVDHFAGLDISEDTLWMLVAGFTGYAGSRGIAKVGRKKDAPSSDDDGG